MALQAGTLFSTESTPRGREVCIVTQVVAPGRHPPRGMGCVAVVAECCKAFTQIATVWVCLAHKGPILGLRTSRPVPEET